ncbi:MAG: hypothetical protein IJ083_14085 [Clostridia bacterium]|nr:hypothetical protein [Clostridia bacterium]
MFSAPDVLNSLQLTPEEQSRVDTIAEQFVNMVARRTADPDFLEASTMDQEEIDALIREKDQIMEQARKRDFQRLDYDPDSILIDFMQKARDVITALAADREDPETLLDPGVVSHTVQGICHYHLSFLKENASTHHENAMKYLESLLDNPGLFQTGKLSSPAEGQDADQEDKTPVVYRTQSPKMLVSTTDSISNMAFKNVEQLNAVNVNSGRDYTTVLSINFDNLDEMEDLSLSRKLTAYDRCVHDAVITLYQETGDTYITAAMIYHIMTGNSKARITEAQTNKIFESLTRQMKVTVSIDETNGKKGKDERSFYQQTQLINAVFTRVRMNGNTVNCIQLLAQPLLLRYASSRKQITRGSMELFNIPGIRFTDEYAVLSKYLWRRIEMMKSSSISRVIRFDTLYDDVLDLPSKNLTPSGRTNKKQDVRATVFKILDFWKSKSFIRDYTTQQQRKSYYSMTIMLNS